jgi:tRNA C32,U32 (ribose-2'-O)-methylase TrmJ
MPRQITEQEQRRLAQGAKDALANHAIVETLKALERDAIEAYRGTELQDTQKREILYMQLRGITELAASLKRLSETTNPAKDGR